MSSDKIPSSSIFNSLDSVNKSLETISERLDRLEHSLRDVNAAETSIGPGGLKQLPAIIERITGARDLDGVVLSLLESLESELSRSLVFNYQDGEYVAFHQRGFEGVIATGESLTRENAGPLLTEAIDSGQMVIFKGDLSGLLPSADGVRNRGGYGVVVPLVFGKQAPLILYGEADDAPDPDLIESVVSIACLVIKNQHLTAMLSKDLSSITETMQVSPGEAHPPAYETDTDEGIDEMTENTEEDVLETSEIKDPGDDFSSGEQDAIRRSIDDFDSDIISAEDLIRSFNIDINGGIDEQPDDAEEEYLDSVISSGEGSSEEEEFEGIKVDFPAGETGIEIEIPSIDEPGEEDEREARLDRSTDDEEVIHPAGYRIDDIGPEDQTEEGEKAGEEVSSGDAPAPFSSAADLESDLELPEEELEEALSFARLLVSEIKLYNEKEVEEGRKEGDLYDRLREQIDISRKVYENRVPEEIRSSKSYFDEELIRILARGDAGLLGIAGD